MKADTHPISHEVKAKCGSCEKEYILTSTKENISVDVCSNCHPFYTGVKSNKGAAGRIDKFNKRYNR